MSALLENLNPEQRRAVETTEGPLLILAGAGSGKTRVLTRRVGYLLERGVRPWNILAVTFTNKAAAEMKERVTHLVGPPANDVWVSTFHSTCVRILRRDIEALGYGRSFVIYDDDDQTRVIKQILAELKIDVKKQPPSMFRSLIDRTKNAMREADGAAHPRLLEVFERYEKRLRAANALDFNDLVNKVVVLWEQHPDVLAKWQDRFRYVLVDEYQDTNPAQYRLIKLLAAARENLAVVGDDDQSIYSFRGADIRNILDFEKDFPKAAVIRLEQNYRSTAAILRAASSLVSRNTQRKDKTLRTEAPEGELLRLLVSNDETDEAAAIVGEMRRLIATGRKPSDLAVIYRTNALSRPIEQALVEAKIPHVLVGGRKFYERREVRDVLSYLKLVLNPADDIAFARVINTPTRGIGEKAFASIEDFATRHGIPHRSAAREMGGQGGKVANTLAAFTMMMDRFEQLALTTPPGELVMKVAEDTGYLAELRAEKTDEAEGRIENIEELGRAMAEEVDEDGNSLEPLDALRVFLDRVALSGQADDLPGDDGGKVTLLTAHLAKGLEYPVVFIIGLVEKGFPHARAELDADIEEERRLAYVAITRARERLYLSYPERRRGRDGYWEPTLRSRFLREIPSELFHGAKPAPARSAPSGSPSWRGPPAPPRPPSPPSFSAPAARAPVPRPPSLFPEMPRTDGPKSASFAPNQRVVTRPPGRTLLPESLDSFRVGIEVFHPLLGTGTIQRCESIPANLRLTIHFRDHGPRTIYASSAKLEIVLS